MTPPSSLPRVNSRSVSWTRAAATIVLACALFGTAVPAHAQGGGWQVQNLPALPTGSTYSITAVSALNQDEIWVAGYITPSGDAFVAKTANGGALWEVVHQSAMATINRMRMLPAVGFIAGDSGLFRSSLDGGVTWIQEQNDYFTGQDHYVGPEGHVYGLAAVDSAHIWTTGWDGYNLGSIYHRVPERAQPDPGNPNLNTPWWLEWTASSIPIFGVAAVDTAKAWAVGYQGSIWKTTDGGGIWVAQASNTSASLNDVVAVDALTAWAVGENGAIIKTTNGGSTWTVQTSNTTETLTRIAALDASVAWAVGTSGVILHTTDGGGTWARQLSGTYARLTGVAAVSSTSAWVVGEANTLLATTDGGDGAWASPTITSVTPNVVGELSYPYMTLTVTGTGFRGGNLGVTFGAVAAESVTWVSTTTLLVTAPSSQTGSVGLTITNEDGQSATLPGAVVYVPAPIITGFSPLHGPASGGYQITVNGLGLQGVVLAELYIMMTVEPYELYESVPFTVLGPTQVVLTVPASGTRPDGVAYIILTTAQSQNAYANDFLLDPPAGPTLAIDSIAPQSGAWGTSVTITGVGFTSSTTLQICGVDAPIASRSATQLIATMRSHATGWCSVQLEDAGTIVIVDPGFRAGALTAPTIAQVDPAWGPAEGGTTVTITGTGLNQTGYVAVTFGGYRATITSLSSTTLVVESPAHPEGAVDVIVVPVDGGGEPVAPAAVASSGFTYRPQRPVRFDFTGDFKSDVLWRHATLGQVWLWPMNGPLRQSESFVRTVADTDWEIRGQGDLNGDGTADLLWRNKTTGTIYYWPMSAGTPSAETYVATVDKVYDIVGTGDFDGDGNSDILWRNPAVGDLWIWLMNGAAVESELYVATVAPGYAVKAVGHVDGDTKADIVWQGTAGDVWVWLMNGATRLSQASVGTVADTNYQIQQVADFDGNGTADILWWNTSAGDVWIWLMNGATVASQSYVGTVADTSYRIAGTGDYNGNGTADLLWRNVAYGDVWMWLMNGTTKLSEHYVGTVSELGYQIVK